MIGVVQFVQIRSCQVHPFQRRLKEVVVVELWVDEVRLTKFGEELSPVNAFLGMNSLDDSQNPVRDRVGVEVASDVFTAELAILDRQTERQPFDFDLAFGLYFGEPSACDPAPWATRVVIERDTCHQRR